MDLILCLKSGAVEGPWLCRVVRASQRGELGVVAMWGPRELSILVGGLVKMMMTGGAQFIRCCFCSFAEGESGAVFVDEGPYLF